MTRLPTANAIVESELAEAFIADVEKDEPRG